MCGETHLAHGIVAWLCYPCRKNWQRKILNNPMSDEYAELELEFDFWQLKAKKTPTDEVLEAGKGIFRKMTAIENKINKIAIEWLASATKMPRYDDE